MTDLMPPEEGYNETTRTVAFLLFVIFSIAEGYVFFYLRNHTYFYLLALAFVISIVLVIWIFEKKK